MLTAIHLAGLMPGNFLHVTSGAAIRDASAAIDSAEAGSTGFLSSFLLLCVLQFVAVLPVVFKPQLRRLQQRLFGASKAA